MDEFFEKKNHDLTNISYCLLFPWVSRIKTVHHHVNLLIERQALRYKTTFCFFFTVSCRDKLSMIDLYSKKVDKQT